MEHLKEFNKIAKEISTAKFSIFKNGKYYQMKIEKSFDTKENAENFVKLMKGGWIFKHNKKYRVRILGGKIFKILKIPHPFEGKMIDHIGLDEDLKHIFIKFIKSRKISNQHKRMEAKKRSYDEYKKWSQNS